MQNELVDLLAQDVSGSSLMWHCHFPVQLSNWCCTLMKQESIIQLTGIFGAY